MVKLPQLQSSVRCLVFNFALCKVSLWTLAWSRGSFRVGHHPATLNNRCISVMVNVDLWSSAFDNSWAYAAKNGVA